MFEVKKPLFDETDSKVWRPCIIIAYLISCINPTVAQPPVSDFYCETEVMGYYPDYLWIPIPEIRYDRYTGVIFFSIFPNTNGSLNTSQIDLTRQADFVQDRKSVV